MAWIRSNEGEVGCEAAHIHDEKKKYRMVNWSGSSRAAADVCSSAISEIIPRYLSIYHTNANTRPPTAPDIGSDDLGRP